MNSLAEKIMAKNKENPVEDLKGFLEQLQKESPRAAVIIAGAYLDEQLRQIIICSFVNKSSIADDLVGTEKKIDRPLSSFSSRIKLAYCLGLINKQVYDDLEIIRRIRNRFAHKLHNYSWDEPEIKEWCKKLKHSKIISKIDPNIGKTHGELFVLGVVQIANWLGLELKSKSK